jgi:hypothetical protein
MDCTNVYHNDEVYSLLHNAGITPLPSAGFSHRVEGGYPPNSHDCMPCDDSFSKISDFLSLEIVFFEGNSKIRKKTGIRSLAAILDWEMTFGAVNNWNFEENYSFWGKLFLEKSASLFWRNF